MSNTEQVINKPELQLLGNLLILELPKTAYFCSERFQPQAVLSSYDWAKRMREENRCVISGFQSRIETDVLEILLRGTSPVILVLARSIYKKIPLQYRSAVDAGNMLIVSPFPAGFCRADNKTAYKRNCWIMQNADKVIIGSMTPGGMLERAVKSTGVTPIFLEN